MRGDIFYEEKYLIHCIMYRGIGIEFCWVPSHCGHYWNEISQKVAKQGATKKMSEISSSNLYSRHMRLLKYLRRLRIKQIEKSKICDTFFFKVFSKKNIQVTSKFTEH